MELKEYQRKCLSTLQSYLTELHRLGVKYREAVKGDPDLEFDFTDRAWRNTIGTVYQSRKNGVGEYLPNFCLKVPTGGGKTLLATKAIDHIQTCYLKKNTGLVLWVVPTTQIYRQTLVSLRDREHPYRQALDICSGGRTMLLEKSDRFSPEDVDENLIVMMLMLPSANRLNRETLKVFRDAGGFEAFFPPEDRYDQHERLLKVCSNLDFYGHPDDLFGRQVKSSLGNVLRLLRPVVVIDEGQRAYSALAQTTIRNLNPCLIMELSATPLAASNILISISGNDLNREGMIKLDMHVTNKASQDWRDTLLASVQRRSLLEQKARNHYAATGSYIRPICLVQAERTGRDQRGIGFIHAEDVREYLIGTCGIPEEEVAVKSSEQDDIEGIDLLREDCSIRYIITKHALQEGWDCSFAYVLAVLTNTMARMSLTQLVGRVLRQPYAIKTGVPELDESYIFCFRPQTSQVLAAVKEGLEKEGLGDIAGRVVVDDEEASGVEHSEIRLRERFQQYEGRVYLPRFVVQDGESWREIGYETDIVSRITWEGVDLGAFASLVLDTSNPHDQQIDIGLGEDSARVVTRAGQASAQESLALDLSLVVRSILDVVPNPWVARELVQEAFKPLRDKYLEAVLGANLVFLIEELRKVLVSERDRRAEKVFRSLLVDKKACFFLETNKGGYSLPTRIQVKNPFRKMTKENGDQLQRSLFDSVPDDDFNDMEKAVALCLEEQERLLWWYRNVARRDYYVQGWKRHRIYPDFILASDCHGDEFRKVYVIETKGIHLKNEDTAYKQSIFDLCNEIGRKVSWEDLERELGGYRVEFQVVFEDEWKRRINSMLGTPPVSQVT